MTEFSEEELNPYTECPNCGGWFIGDDNPALRVQDLKFCSTNCKYHYFGANQLQLPLAIRKDLI